MKKFILTAVAVLSLLALAVPAFAQIPANWWPAPVSFVASGDLQAAYTGSPGVSSTVAPVKFANGSQFACGDMNGATPNFSALDTSAAINTGAAWAVADGGLAAASVYGSAESLPYLRFTFTPVGPFSGQGGTAIDSLVAVVQVAPNASGPWTSVDSVSFIGQGPSISGAVTADSTTLIPTAPVLLVAAANPRLSVSALGAAATHLRLGKANAVFVRLIVGRHLEGSFQLGRVSGGGAALTAATAPGYSVTAYLYTRDPDWTHR